MRRLRLTWTLPVALALASGVLILAQSRIPAGPRYAPFAILRPLAEWRGGGDELKRLRSEKKPVPGFGHPFHKPDDPRSPRLIAVAEEAGVKGDHIRALKLLAKEVDAAWGRHLTINATGAVAALLGEIGIPQEVMRGVAVVSRAAGLVGHILEEKNAPSARYLWDLAEENITYEP